MAECKGLGIPEVIGDKQASIQQLAAEHRAFDVRVFGSVARGEARPDSDVDFLVRFHEGASLFDMVGLWQDLQDLLGRSVDVVDEDGMKARLRPQVLRDAVPL
jgi:predicted nucleotidyltransferase